MLKIKRRYIYNALAVTFIGILVCFAFKAGKWLAIYRYKNFTNLVLTIAITKTVDCSKGGCSIYYVYSVDSVLYGGSCMFYNDIKYPNESYYIIYSKDNPTHQIILPEYNINKPLKIDSIKKEYIIKRLIEYHRTDKKEDWGGFWEDYFEVQKR